MALVDETSQLAIAEILLGLRSASPEIAEADVDVAVKTENNIPEDQLWLLEGLDAESAASPRLSEAMLLTSLTTAAIHIQSSTVEAKQEQQQAEVLDKTQATSTSATKQNPFPVPLKRRNFAFLYDDFLQRFHHQMICRSGCKTSEHVIKFDNPPVHHGATFDAFKLYNVVRHMSGMAKEQVRSWTEISRRIGFDPRNNTIPLRIKEWTERHHIDHFFNHILSLTASPTIAANAAVTLASPVPGAPTTHHDSTPSLSDEEYLESILMLKVNGDGMKRKADLVDPTMKRKADLVDPTHEHHQLVRQHQYQSPFAFLVNAAAVVSSSSSSSSEQMYLTPSSSTASTASSFGSSGSASGISSPTLTRCSSPFSSGSGSDDDVDDHYHVRHHHYQFQSTPFSQLSRVANEKLAVLRRSASLGGSKGKKSGKSQRGRADPMESEALGDGNVDDVVMEVAAVVGNEGAKESPAPAVETTDGSATIEVVPSSTSEDDTVTADLDPELTLARNNLLAQYEAFLHAHHDRLCKNLREAFGAHVFGGPSAVSSCTTTSDSSSPSKETTCRISDHIARFQTPPRYFDKSLEVVTFLNVVKTFNGIDKIKSWTDLARRVGFSPKDSNIAARMKDWTRKHHVASFFHHLLGLEEPAFTTPALMPPTNPLAVVGSNASGVARSISPAPTTSSVSVGTRSQTSRSPSPAVSVDSTATTTTTDVVTPKSNSAPAFLPFSSASSRKRSCPPELRRSRGRPRKVVVSGNGGGVVGVVGSGLVNVSCGSSSSMDEE
ncbi:hypothetical protein HDU76_007651 [Blyttiomyces sp. JEL0837]|nr:hypothetical protein HDU76_007651 [Blyttiomyces sp. JEL0837]